MWKCSDCALDLPNESFHKNKNNISRDFLQYICKNALK